MIKGIGTDIIDLRRVSKNLDSLAMKILTENEYQIYLAKTHQKHRIEFLGGRFAAKEAIFKATNKQITSFKEIEILTGAMGQPICNYPCTHISIAHENNYAIAYVVVEE